MNLWGAYGACDRTCGQGLKWRYRTIAQQPEPGGGLCASLVMSDVCEIAACPTPSPTPIPTRPPTPVPPTASPTPECVRLAQPGSMMYMSSRYLMNHELDEGVGRVAVGTNQ